MKDKPPGKQAQAIPFEFNAQTPGLQVMPLKLSPHVVEAIHKHGASVTFGTTNNVLRVGEQEIPFTMQGEPAGSHTDLVTVGHDGSVALTQAAVTAHLAVFNPPPPRTELPKKAKSKKDGKDKSDKKKRGTKRKQADEPPLYVPLAYDAPPISQAPLVKRARPAVASIGAPAPSTRPPQPPQPQQPRAQQVPPSNHRPTPPAVARPSRNTHLPAHAPPSRVPAPASSTPQPRHGSSLPASTPPNQGPGKGEGHKGEDEEEGAEVQEAGGEAQGRVGSLEQQVSRSVAADLQRIDAVARTALHDIAGLEIRDAPKVFPPITTVEEYHRLRHDFEVQYGVYKRLDKCLAASTHDFVLLHSYFKSSPYPEVRELAKTTIAKLYNERHEKVQQLLHMYKLYHQELKDIKQAVHTYVDNWRSTHPRSSHPPK